jgi:hypothetical protein
LPNISKINALAIGSVAKGLAKASILDIDGVAVPSAFTGLLDTYTGAAAGYSTRKLKTGVTVAARIRRSGDDIEADVEFDSNNEISLTSPISNASSGTYTDLADFVDHSTTPRDAFVDQWKDQSGSGKHATNGTAANQPKLYDATTGLITENGKAAIYSGTGAAWLVASSFSFSSMFITTAFSRIARKGPNDTVFLFQGPPYNQLYSNSTNWQYFSGSTGYNTGLSLTSDQQLISVADTGTATTYYKNGTAGNTDTISNNVTILSLELFYQRSGATTYGTEGNFQELVLWDSDQSGNRTGIESNINGYFSIYP